MRIISKLRDYYDSGAAYGIDQTVVFERKPKIITKNDSEYKEIRELINIPYSYFSNWNGNRVFYNSTPELKGKYRNIIHLDYQLHDVSIIVADRKYCGKMLVSTNWSPTAEAEVKYFWTDAEFNEWIKTKIPERFHNQFESKGDAFKPNIFSLKESTKEWMLENKIVSISLNIRHGKFTRDIVLNGDNLVLYGLQRIVDATAMFHAVDQWVSMMNDPSRRMVEISDKDKIAKHGMDKTSFRKIG